MPPSTRYVALLRGINLGRRNVKSARLREIFEGMGYADVDTFIASGNVVFTAEAADRDALAAGIEAGLEGALGYTVRTMIRTGDELVAIAEHAAFPGREGEDTGALNIAFLREPVGEDLREQVLALASGEDEFHVHGSEIYWRCRKRMSESTAWAPFEKLVAGRGTVRNVNTIRRMARKFFSST